MARKRSGVPVPDQQAIERLARVEARLDSLERMTGDGIVSLGEQLKGVHACVDALDQKISSNLHGEQQRPGIVVRLDRLEQSHESAKWLIRLVAGTVVTLVIGAIWTLLR